MITVIRMLQGQTQGGFEGKPPLKYLGQKIPHIQEVIDEAKVPRRLDIV